MTYQSTAISAQDTDSLSFEAFDKILSLAQETFEARQATLRDQFENKTLYLYGFGGKGRDLARHIAKNPRYKLTVFDSHPETRKTAAEQGYPVIDDLSAIDIENACVILGACQAQAEQARIVKKNSVYFQETAYYFDAPHLANSSRDFPEYILQNREKFYSKYLRIAPSSRSTFLAVLRFRITANPMDLAHDKKKNSDMWFDIPESLSHRQYSTFLDIGAFDGDTLRFALDRLSITRGIAVEANENLIASIMRVSADITGGILVLPHAAWSHACRLSFSEVRNGMIQVSESPDGEIAAAPVEHYVREPVDLLKMDIEGAEIRALVGCRQILKKFVPDLEIAAYHRPDDLITLIDFIDEEFPEGNPYQIHVGHYSDCIDDTIIYFLKPSR